MNGTDVQILRASMCFVTWFFFSLSTNKLYCQKKIVTNQENSYQAITNQSSRSRNNLPKSIKHHNTILKNSPKTGVLFILKEQV